MSLPADTIAAISTPPGPGAIGILRLSGPRAVEVAQASFRPLNKMPLSQHRPHELVYGDLLDRDGQPIDRVLCTFSRGPVSYTGEDTAEFQCHGSPMVLSLGLEALFSRGARQARAGEFTRRAFLTPPVSSPGPCPGALPGSTPPWWISWPTSTPCWTTLTRTSTPSAWRS